MSDTQDSSCDEFNQQKDNTVQIQSQQTVYASIINKQRQKLLQSVWVYIFNVLLLHCQTFDELKTSIETIVDQFKGEQYKTVCVTEDEGYYYRYRGSALFQISYQDSFETEMKVIIKSIQKKSSQNPNNLDFIVSEILQELSKSATLHFIIKEFLIKNTKILDQYFHSHLEEVQRIDFMMNNSIERMEQNSKLEVKLYPNNTIYKLNVLDNIIQNKQVQSLYFKIQSFIKIKNNFFKKRKDPVYLIRKNIIQSLIKIQKLFLNVQSNNLKQRQKNMQILLKLKTFVQNSDDLPFVMNILQSEMVYLKKCISQSLTVDNIEFRASDIKVILKQLIKALSKKQELINYLNNEHQIIYKQSKSITNYMRVFAIQNLYKCCLNVKIEIEQSLIYKTIKLFDQYIIWKKNYSPGNVEDLFLSLFYIVVKNDSKHGTTQNLKQLKSRWYTNSKWFDKYPERQADVVTFLEYNNDFSKVRTIYDSALMLIQELYQIFLDKEIVDSIEFNQFLVVLTRAAIMDECYFVFTEQVISLSILFILQQRFNKGKQNAQNRKLYDKISDKMMHEQNKKKELTDCYIYLNDKYIKSNQFIIRLKEPSKNNIFYEKTFSRKVLNSQVRLFWFNCQLKVGKAIINYIQLFQ